MTENRSDLEAWQALLDCPGWALLVRKVHQEWGAGGLRFEHRLNQLADSTDNDAQTLMHIRQIAVARREILRILDWPMTELGRLKKLSEVPAEETGRPPFQAALTGQSRRGGL